MNLTDEELMDEFDAEPLATRPPMTSACAFRPYPSLDTIPPSYSASPLPRYPSLSTAAPAEPSIAPRSGAPLVVTNAPSLAGSGQDASAAPPVMPADDDKSACSANMAHAPSPPPLSSAEIIAQAAEIDALTQHESAVQAHEVRSMQVVFDHIGQALRGETPHQLEQRRLREAARLERAEERAQRALARQASSLHPGHRHSTESNDMSP